MFKTFYALTVLPISVSVLTSSLQAVEEGKRIDSSTISSDSKESQTSHTNHQEQIAAWKQEAAQVAQDYVHTIDQGQYGQSWEQGGPLFQNTITRSDWIKSLNLIRKPLGKVISRTLQDNRMVRDPYGLLKGEFMIIEYDTSFENAPQSIEALLLRRDEGHWRVGAYEVLYSMTEKGKPSSLSDQSSQQVSNSAHPMDSVTLRSYGPITQQEVAAWKKAAAQEAEEFVTMLDQGQYGQSWKQGGPLFQSSISQSDWIKELNQTRKPLGKAISRQLKSEHLIQDPYNLLKGIFMVVEYDTSFENASKGRENLILRRGPEGQWVVGSYDVYYHTRERELEQKNQK